MHTSDCALNDGPAYVPGPCSCGVEPGRQPDADTSTWPLDLGVGTLPRT